MKFALLVLGDPRSTEACDRALRFAHACLESGHEILRVFFYHDAVHCGSALAQAPQGQPDVAAAWRNLQQAQNLDLVLCIGSAVKRGILDADEAARYEKAGASMLNGFRLSGLGEWLEACIDADRCLEFGP